MQRFPKILISTAALLAILPVLSACVVEPARVRPAYVLEPTYDDRPHHHCRDCY